jgi:transposase InsO family protein
VPGREAGGKYSSKQERDDNVKTTRTPPYGSLWARCYHSIGGSKYGLIIIDDFSRFTWVFFLQDIINPKYTKALPKESPNEFELKMKKIGSNNGSEFENPQVEEYLEEEGTRHEFSTPYTPHQNGVVERKNRTLIDMTRTMLGEYKTPERFWLEVVNTACHGINRLYLRRFLKKTSYELLTGNKPNVSYFRVFGSKCYILVKKGRHSKFAPKAAEGILLDYDSNAKAYRVFNKSLGLVEVTSDVVFDETNGSPREQVDLDDIDEDEVPTAAMRTVGTLNQGYPFLQHEDAAPMQRLQATRRTVPDPTTWAGQRTPRSKKRQHIPECIVGVRTSTEGYRTPIRISPEPPSKVRTSAKCRSEEDPGVSRGPVPTCVQALPFTSRSSGDPQLVAHDISHRAEPDVKPCSACIY